MKAILSLLFLVLCVFLQACNSNNQKLKPEQFRITGKVLNPKKDGKIRIAKIVGSSLVSFDSATTDEAGKFVLTGKLPQAGPAYFVLDAYETQQILVPLDSASDITAELDGKDPEGKATLKGSKLVESHQEVQGIRNWFEQAQIAVNQTFSNNQTRMADKKFSDSLSEVSRQNDMELARKIKQKINQEGPTIISLYASGQLNPEVDFVFMDSLARVFKVAKKGEMQGVEAFVENLDRISKVREGAMAPAIELPNTEGKALSLASLKGKVVLVDFWASWCGPCRRANPEVVKLYQANKSKGFTVLGVSLDEDKGKWLEAIKKDGLEWNHVSDLKRWESPTAAVWQVASIPATFLIDQDGKIVGRNLHGPALEAKVAELLAKKNS